MNLFKKIFGKKKQPDLISNPDKNQGSLYNTPEEKFAALNSDERLGAIMSLGDTGQNKYFDLLKFSIQSDPDMDVRFAALKRIHLFKEHPDLIKFLQRLNDDDDKKPHLEPYLSMALSHVGIITQEEFQRRINTTPLKEPPGNNKRWAKFDKGTSFGTAGSEGGKIIEDVECIDGARVTIEKDGDNAPFSVTLGIYGVMFHTHFSSTEADAKKFMELAIIKIDEIFSLYETSESARDSKWHDKHNHLISDLAEQ